MVSPLVRTQQETVFKETSNGTWYSIRSLSATGINYFVVDMMGDKEFEIVQASCQVASENHALYGQLKAEWEGAEGEWYHSFLSAKYFTNLKPWTLERTIRLSGPCRLVFETELTGANLAYFNCFIRMVEVQSRWR